jgi:hypothetical protein
MQGPLLAQISAKKMVLRSFIKFTPGDSAEKFDCVRSTFLENKALKPSDD